MSSHEIDNGEPLFQFDPYESSGGAEFLEGSSRSPIVISPGALARGILPYPQLAEDNQLDDPVEHEVDEDEESHNVAGKGKEVSKPMPIRPPTTSDIEHDLFDMSPSSFRLPSRQNDLHPSTSSSQTPSSFQFYSFPTPHDDMQAHFTSMGHNETTVQHGTDVMSGKCKGREPPPSLPPLCFSPTEFGYEKTGWPSPDLVMPGPGPSSYGSGYASTTDLDASSHPDINNSDSSPIVETRPILRRIPSRRRSLSNLSIRSTQSLAARSMTRVKVKLRESKGASNLARKLLFRKHDTPHMSCLSSPHDSVGDLRSTDSEIGKLSHSNCLSPWRGGFKTRKGTPSTMPFTDFDVDASFNVAQLSLPTHPCSLDSSFKGKGRSYSSPLPLSALDFIPVSSADVFTPIPVVVRNLFDEMLPREVQLNILASLVSLHESKHMRVITEGVWTALKASSTKHRWVGKDGGIRELVRLSRVSGVLLQQDWCYEILVHLGFEILAGARLRRPAVDDAQPPFFSKVIDTFSLAPYQSGWPIHQTSRRNGSYKFIFWNPSRGDRQSLRRINR
jgi:F-box/leucine-rich repeat protein 2/20